MLNVSRREHHASFNDHCEHQNSNRRARRPRFRDDHGRRQESSREHTEPPDRDVSSTALGCSLEFSSQPPSQLEVGTTMSQPIMVRICLLYSQFQAFEDLLSQCFAVISLVGGREHAVAPQGVLAGQGLAVSIRWETAVTREAEPCVVGSASFTGLSIHRSGQYGLQVTLMKIGEVEASLHSVVVLQVVKSERFQVMPKSRNPD